MLVIAIRWRTEAFEAPNVEDLIEAEYRPGHWKTGVDNGEIYPSQWRFMGFHGDLMGFHGDLYNGISWWFNGIFHGI